MGDLNRQQNKVSHDPLFVSLSRQRAF